MTPTGATHRLRVQAHHAQRTAMRAATLCRAALTKKHVFPLVVAEKALVFDENERFSGTESCRKGQGFPENGHFSSVFGHSADTASGKQPFFVTVCGEATKAR